jgi:hypothetical protein
MAITVSNLVKTYQPSGAFEVKGLATPTTSYNDATKEVMDLSAYLSGTPLVTISGAGPGGYCMAHDCGTAAAAKVTFYQVGSAGRLAEISNGMNISACTFAFVATGTPV